MRSRIGNQLGPNAPNSSKLLSIAWHVAGAVEKSAISTTGLRCTPRLQFSLEKITWQQVAKRHDVINLQSHRAQVLKTCAICYRTVAVRAISTLGGQLSTGFSTC